MEAQALEGLVNIAWIAVGKRRKEQENVPPRIAWHRGIILKGKLERVLQTGVALESVELAKLFDVVIRSLLEVTQQTSSLFECSHDCDFRQRILVLELAYKVRE